MSRLAEAAANLRLAWRLGRFDGSAAAAIPDDDRSVWRSFWAAPLVLATQGLAGLLTADALADAETSRHSLGPGWIVVNWLIALNIAAEFARVLGRIDAFPRYVVAHNWATAVQAIVLAAATLAAYVAAPDLRLFAVAVVTFWALAYDWFVARTVLEIDGLPAAVLIAAQIGMSLAVLMAANYLVSG